MTSSHACEVFYEYNIFMNFLQPCTVEETCWCSVFTEWWEQCPHLSIAGSDCLLGIPQLWREAGPDGHTHQDVAAAIVVTHTTMHLATDKTRQPVLLVERERCQNTTRPLSYQFNKYVEVTLIQSEAALDYISFVWVFLHTHTHTL